MATVKLEQTPPAAKNELQVVPLRTGGAVAGIIPQTIDEVVRLAQGIAKSGLAPSTMNTAEKITVAILTGLEIGLPPMFSLQKIAVVNGRPALWGDALPALLWSRGFSLKEWTDGDTAYCTVTRPNGDAITRTFSDADAKAAGLLGKAGPWTQYKPRMRAMRARGFACRDGAADVLGGLYVAEELDDIEPTPRKSSASAKRDGTTERFNALKKQISEAYGQRDVLLKIKADNALEWDAMPFGWVEILDNDLADALESCRGESEA